MKTPTASRERREARRARSANGLNPRGGVNRRGEGRRDHHGRGGPPRPRGEEETSTGAPAATGRRGRKSPQTHLGRRTHQRRVTAAASPFSPRGGPDARGRPPPAPHNVHTQNAAAAAGPGPPSNCSTRTRRAASPGPRRTPEARPRVHGATLPPRGARVPASTAAGVGPDTREPAAAGGEGERHGKDEMPATAGATTGTGPLTRARTEREAAPALAATGRTPGGENGRESHRSHSGSGPATPAAPNRVDPRNDDGPPNGEPRGDATREAAERRRHRRRGPLERERDPPDVRRRAGRGRPPSPKGRPRERDRYTAETRTTPDPPEGGKVTRAPPTVGTLPRRGGERDDAPPHEQTTTHAPRAATSKSRERQRRGRAREGRTRRAATGWGQGNRDGWDREPTTALPLPVPRRPTGMGWGRPRARGGAHAALPPPLPPTSATRTQHSATPA